MHDSQTSGQNRDLAALLHDVATALRIKGANSFEANAYDTAAAGVLQFPVPIGDLWHSGRLTDIPGVGPSIATAIDEWLRSGRSRRLDEALAGLPEGVLELVRVPGIGPATALKLSGAGVQNLEDLEHWLARGETRLAGVGPKIIERIASGLAELRRRPDRMLLASALLIAEPLLAQLRAIPTVRRAEVAGSVRRRCATVADIDIAVASADTRSVFEHLRVLPGVDDITRYPDGADAVRLILSSGRRVDVFTCVPEQFGALLVWLTGSAAHVRALSQRAAGLGLTLAADGLRDAVGRPLPAAEEGDVYRRLDLAVPPPELRESGDEVEAAANGALPDLITAGQVRGDCHTHSSWSPDARDSVLEMLEAARALGREYIVLTDHSYPNLEFARRLVQIEELRRSYPHVRLISGLEVNITSEGTLQVPDEVLAAHGFCLGSIHSSFRQPPEVITRRLLAAIAHPSINAIAHPTARLLLRREGVEADWEAVFDACLEHDKALEIDGPADRLDLPDDLVREAVRRGVKLIIDSDAHATEELTNTLGGIDVARRGWVEARHVLNVLPYEEFLRAAHVR